MYIYTANCDTTSIRIYLLLFLVCILFLLTFFFVRYVISVSLIYIFELAVARVETSRCITPITNLVTALEIFSHILPAIFTIK